MTTDKRLAKKASRPSVIKKIKIILQRIPADNWPIIRDWINDTLPAKISRDQHEKIKRLGRGGNVYYTGAVALGSPTSSRIHTIIRFGSKRVLTRQENGALWRIAYEKLKPLTEAVLEKAQ